MGNKHVLFLSPSDPLNSCNGDRYIRYNARLHEHMKPQRWRQQRHAAAATIALRPPQAPIFLAQKRCMHRSKVLGRKMLESAGLHRAAAATAACSICRERRESTDDRWPGEHDGRQQRAG